MDTVATPSSSLDPSPDSSSALPRLLTPWVESPFFQREVAARRARLSPAHQELATKFHRDGYAVAEGLIPADLCDRIREETGDALAGAGRIPDAWRDGATSTRELATLPAVQYLLEVLYERRPIPFQTLNFRVGTQQMPHSDSVHFTSFPARFMCGVWVALEDIDEESGPLFYFPGSQELPEITLYDLSLPAEGEWFDRYGAYERFQQELMASRGWKPVPFLAKKGDALIWSSNVIHGGSPIDRSGSTRWSQVTHYLFDDCIYYQPHSSIVPLGELKLLDVIDLNTLEPVPHRFNGQPVVVTPLPNGRSRISIEPTPAPPPEASWSAVLDATKRALDDSGWGRQVLRGARSARRRIQQFGR